MNTRRIRRQTRASERRTTQPAVRPADDAVPAAVEVPEVPDLGPQPGVAEASGVDREAAPAAVASKPVDLDELTREGRSGNMKMVKKRDLRLIIGQMLEQVLAERDDLLGEAEKRAVIERTRDHLKHSARHVKSLEDTLHAKDDEKKRIADRLAQWQARAEAAEADRGALHAQLADAESRIDTVRAEADTRLGALQEECAARTRELEELRRNLGEARRQSSGEGDAARAAQAAAEGRLAAAQARVAHLEREAQILRGDVERLRKTGEQPREIDSLRRAIADWSAGQPGDGLAERLQELPNAAAILRGGAELIRHLDAYCSGARVRLEEAEQKIEQLAFSQADVAVHQAELEAAEAEREQLTRRLAAVRSERDHLREALASRDASEEGRDAELTELRRRLAAVEQQAARSLADRDTAMEDLKATRREQERAQAARDAAHDVRDAERQRAAQLAAEIGRRDARIRELEQKLLGLEAAEVERRARGDELSATRVSDLEEALQRARADGIEVAQRLKEKEKEFEIATAGGRVEQLEQDLDTARRANADLQQRLRQQEADLLVARAGATPVGGLDTAELDRLREELDRERAVRQRSETTARLMEAENALARAQARVEDLRRHSEM